MSTKEQIDEMCLAVAFLYGTNSRQFDEAKTVREALGDTVSDTEALAGLLAIINNGTMRSEEPEDKIVTVPKLRFLAQAYTPEPSRPRG